MRFHKVALGMAVLSIAGASLSACHNSSETNEDLGRSKDLGTSIDLLSPPPKAVYTMSNDMLDNKIYVYSRAADGTLTASNSYSTGGKGTALGLGDQNGLIFDATQSLFFVVNAGDSSISMMSLKSDGSLVLLSHVNSGGLHPVSVTSSGSVVYVVNAGDMNLNISGNISGFQISGGVLTPISGAKQSLSQNNAGPAQIQFTPSGAQLIVTEKTNSKIDVFPVVAGIAGTPMYQSSAGTTPFGFAFSATQKLIVSEAAGGVANMGSASSYSISPNGTLTTVSSKVTSGQTAPCWVAVAGNTAYVTNAQTNNVTSYTVAADGTLALVGNGSGVAAGMGATDEDVTDGNDFLYVRNNGDHSLSIFAINTDGSLVKKPDFTGLPMTAVGLVAR